jgi:hypothetical protein
MLLMATPVHAGSYYCDICGESHDYGSDIATPIVTEFMQDAKNVNFFRNDEGTGLSLTELLEFDVEENDIFNSMWYGDDGVTSVKTIFDALVPVASVLAVIFFLLEIGEKVFSEHFNAEQLVLSFVRLGLALLVIMNGFDILTAINTLCSNIFETVKDSASITTTTGATCFFESASAMSLFEKAGCILSVLISYLFMLIAWIMILATAWKRIFDIIVYAMFFPIGISDVVRGGLDSSGVSYMKKMAAKFLQGTIVLTIIIAYNLVSSLALSTGSGAGNFGSVILALTVMTLMLQSESIASAIVGA